MATTLDIQIKAAIDTASAAKNVKDLRKAIKDLNSVGLSLGKDQRKEFEKIAEAVGEARDRVEDLRDDMNAFQGSTVERLNASVNVLGEGFQNLDIDKIGAQFKNLGSVIAANPLLVLSQLIIKLVENFDELAASGGVIGDVFKGIGAIIGTITNGFNTLLSALGLTSSAMNVIAEENKKIFQESIDFVNKLADETAKASVEILKLQGKVSDEAAAQVGLYEKFQEDLQGITDKYTKIRDEQVKASGVLEATNIDDKIEKQKRLNIILTQLGKSSAKEKAALERRLDEEIEAERLKGVKATEKKIAKAKKEEIKSYYKEIQDIENGFLINETERNSQLAKLQAERLIAEVNASNAKQSEKTRYILDIQTKLQIDLIALENKRQAEEKKLSEERIALAQKEADEILKIEQDQLITEQRIVEEATAKAVAFQQLKDANTKANEEKIKQQSVELAFKSAQAIQQIENERTARETEANKKQLDFIEVRADRELASLNKRKDAELITQSQLDVAEAQLAQKKQAQKEAIDKKQRALEVKAFKRNKAFQLAFIAGELAKQIVAIQANAAANPTNALTFGAAGLTQAAVLTALAIASSAIQAGTILAQKPPAFARGGIVTGAGSGTSDSITARLSNGESVINANSTQAFAPLLSAINQIGGGQSFLPESTSGTAGSVTGNSQPIIKTYVVESDITNSQKNASRTKRLSSI